MKNLKITKVLMAFILGLIFVTSTACGPTRYVPGHMVPAGHYVNQHGLVMRGMAPPGFYIGVGGLLHRGVVPVGAIMQGGRVSNSKTVSTTTTTKSGRPAAKTSSKKAVTASKRDSISARAGQNKAFTKRDPKKEQKAASAFEGKSKTEAKSGAWFNSGGSKPPTSTSTKRRRAPGKSTKKARRPR